MMRSFAFAAAITLLVGCLSPASAGPDDIVVEGAWSRASIGVIRPGVAYMSLRNEGEKTMTLTGIRTDLAAMSELHETSTNAQGISSMAPAGDIEIAPGATVELKPGGLHAMLMRLQRPMVKGDVYPLTLIFSDGSEKTVEIPVLDIRSLGPDG